MPKDSYVIIFTVIVILIEFAQVYYDYLFITLSLFKWNLSKFIIIIILIESLLNWV